MGDTMVLLYIDNKTLLTKLILYLEQAKHPYTTSLDDHYDIIVVAEPTKKVLEFMKQKKKIIFLTELEEKKIEQKFNKNNKLNREYKNKLIKILNHCYRVIVTEEYFKKLLKKYIQTDIVVIPKEIPNITVSKNNKEIYETYKISKRKKKIILLDLNYECIETVYNLTIKYPEYQFIYIGYKPMYSLPNKQKELLNKMPSNVILIKYIDLKLYSELVKFGTIVILFDPIEIDYLYTPMLLKKHLLINEPNCYQDTFINSKHLYTFEHEKELFIKFEKILKNRISNLTEEAYLKIKDNYFTNIMKQYSIYFK